MANSLRVVIAAAGTGSRMKSNINKQFMQLNGKPVLYYSLHRFNQLDIVDEIVVVAHHDEIDYCKQNVIDKYQFTKAKVVEGGQHRQQSVLRGLISLSDDTKYVAVHDGARPLLTCKLILQLFAEAMKYQAAIPGIWARETLKTVDEYGYIKETLDRSQIVSVQTPQIFNYHKLLKAYELGEKEGFIGTDDASLYERYIGKVKLVIGDYTNLKITTPEDLMIAEYLLKNTIL